MFNIESCQRTFCMALNSSPRQPCVYYSTEHKTSQDNSVTGLIDFFVFHATSEVILINAISHSPIQLLQALAKNRFTRETPREAIIYLVPNTETVMLQFPSLDAWSENREAGFMVPAWALVVETDAMYLSTHIKYGRGSHRSCPCSAFANLFPFHLPAGDRK